MSLQVSFRFPLIMKMQMVVHEVLTPSTTMNQLQKIIYDRTWDAYWQTFTNIDNTSNTSQHGRPDQIQISYQNEVVDKIERLFTIAKIDPTFDVVFRK